jgi:hypothetical protein
MSRRGILKRTNKGVPNISYSSVLMILNIMAASAPPAKFATKNTQRLLSLLNPIMVIPIATAGFMAQPEILPIEYAAAIKVNPIANP